MKTPWNSLLQYGAGFATMAVVLLAGLIMFAIIGIAVLLGKLWVFIK